MQTWLTRWTAYNLVYDHLSRAFLCLFPSTLKYQLEQTPTQSMYPINVSTFNIKTKSRWTSFRIAEHVCVTVRVLRTIEFPLFWKKIASIQSSSVKCIGNIFVYIGQVYMNISSNVFIKFRGPQRCISVFLVRQCMNFFYSLITATYKYYISLQKARKAPFAGARSREV